jgi:hypothetical protein
VTIRERIATALIRGAAARMWGMPVNLMGEIVVRLGAGRALLWFAINLPRYERTRILWGPVRTHLVCAQASLLNACAYCTFAHAYALQLYYFKEHGRLFPLDEHEIVALRNGSDEELRAAFAGAAREAGLGGEVPMLERLWGLKIAGAAAGNSDDDRRLLHLIDMFNMLNYCAIDSRVPLDSAHDPINKDEALKVRYAEARLAARRDATGG